VAAEISALILGHPWDLWGLSQIFNGTNLLGVRISADKPRGKPRIDFKDRDGIPRFMRSGYDRSAHLTATFLQAEITNHGDLDDIANKVSALVESINGVAKLLDPAYYGVRLYSLVHKQPNGHSDIVLWTTETPNKASSGLGSLSQFAVVAPRVIALSLTDPAIRFALEAYNLPLSWASLYLIYDCIASKVGGAEALKAKNWVSKKKVVEFTNAANNSRDLRDGARHGKNPDEQTAARLIPLHKGRDIIVQITLGWLHERISANN
jgi:hypothetical protein